MEKRWKMGSMGALAALVLLLTTVETAKLNKPRVLLPLYSQFPNNFTLQVDDGGCYKWSTKNPTTIQLSTIDPVQPRGCSSLAVVSAVISEVGRHTAIIIAEDVSSGEVLRCDVIVDSIASLSIVTTTREIFIEEAPEVFEVRAYDDLGNQFTTLEGFSFEWKVSTVAKRKKEGLLPTVIRVIKFEDSHYKTPSASLAEIENAGLHGNKVLLYGVSTGQAEISVSLTQPQYQNVKASPSVILAVVANLLLDPLDTLLMPNSKVSYRLELVRHGRQEQMLLPSEQYQLEVEDLSIGSLQSDGVIVEALAVGKTRVILRDMNAVDSEEESRTTSAILRVANPAALEISVLPHKSWYLIVGREYKLHVNILDSNRHVFHIGEGLDIAIDINSEYYSHDGKTACELHGRAQQIGSVPVIARLPNTKYSVQKQVIINEQIKVKPVITYLPWSKIPQPYEIKLEASARTGDGSTPFFLWHSKTPRLAVVDQDGLVTTRSSDIHVSNISVALDKDPLNVAHAQIQFLPPCKLEIVGKTIQAEMGSTLYVPISLKLCGKKTVEFLAADCQHVRFGVDTDSGLHYDDRIPNKGPQDKPSCASIPLKSDVPLLAKVTVSLDMQLDDGNLIHLEDTATISFYKPLRVVYPESAQTVLAPGSSRNIVFEGGPRAMTGQSQLTRKLLFTDTGLAQVWDLDKNSISYVLARVQCNEIGTTNLELVLTPKKDSSNVQARGVVKVICAMPDVLTLTPNLPVPDFETCMIPAGSYVSLAKSEVNVVAIALDSKNRKFDNFSSLNMEWGLDPTDLVTKLPKEMFEDVVREETYGVILPGPSYHSIRPHGHSGMLTVSAILTAEKAKISAQTAIFFLEEVQINPSSVTVYNHTGKLSKIKISKGSNSYLLNTLEGKDVADVKLVKARRALEIAPLRPGRARISVVDGCLPKETRTAATAEITVLGIGSVIVTLASQVQEGSTIEGSLTILGTNGQQMTPPSAVLVKHKADPRINVKLSANSPLNFFVSGVSLGDAELAFIVDDVRSQPTSVFVFPPIKIWPGDLVLVPGSVMQTQTRGGPNVPDAVLEFSSNSLERHPCLHSSPSGMIEARCVGNGAVTVKAIAPDGSVYSEDTAPVRIVSLSAVEIIAPTTVLEQGTRMPVYLQGKSDTGEVISPFVVATLDSKCIWSEHGGRLNIKSAESVANVDAINVGTADLTAEFHLADGTRLTSSTSIEVIPTQRLILPVNGPSAAPILIAPFSKVQLAVTNGKFFSDCGGDGIISVTENGLVSSLGPQGRSTIVVSDHKTNQKLIVGITVVPITYLMVQTTSPFPNSVYPRGLQSTVNISYHDSIGREIIVPTNERSLNWMSSKPQTLSLAQDRMQLGEPGKAVVDIWDGAQHAYFKLRVKQIISPTQLNQGDVVCFNVGHSGIWSSLSSTALDIDPKTGWAVALAAGESNVNFASNEGASTWAEVQVSAASSIQLSPPAVASFSSNQPFEVAVVIKPSSKNDLRKNNLVESNCQPPASGSLPSLVIDCKAAWEGRSDSTLVAEASFDFRSGQHVCRVSTQSKDRTNKINLHACLANSNMCSEKLTATFYSPVEISAKELNLKEQTGEIIIRGPNAVLAKIKVEPTPELEIGYPKELSSESISIPVQLTTNFWSLPDAHKYGSVLLKINSPLTGQTFILPVMVDSNMQAPMCPNKPAAFTQIWDILYAIRTELIITVGVLIIIAAVSNMYFTNNSFSSRTYTSPVVTNMDDSPFMPRGARTNGNTSLTSTPLQPGQYPYTSHIYGNQDASWHSTPGRR